MESIEINKKYKDQKKQKVLSDKVNEKIVKQRIAPLVKVRKPIKPPLQGVITKKRQPTGEREAFEDIRNTRTHICEVCYKNINEAKAYCFAHLLAKGMYKKYRLVPLNIVLVCSIECHKEVDKIVAGNKHIVEEMIKAGATFSFIRRSLGL